MSGQILRTMLALYKAGLRYVVEGAGKSVSTVRRSTALAKARGDVRQRADAERGVVAETAPIICAVFIAMALGVASGLWISTGSASPPFEDVPSSVQSPHGLDAAEQTTHALRAGWPENQSDDSNVAPRDASEYVSDESPPAHAKQTRDDEAAGGAGAKTHAGGGFAETPSARDEGASRKTATASGRVANGEANAVAGRSRGNVGPCTLSTDASALTIRGGGGSANVTLRLNGATNAASINAATPNWSDIVMFAGSHTFGNGVLVRWYTVRSVSKRAGLYRVIFSTPCGSKTIPVTVTQP